MLILPLRMAEKVYASCILITISIVAFQTKTKQAVRHWEKMVKLTYFRVKKKNLIRVKSIKLS